jgi:hypothetical protein
VLYDDFMAGAVGVNVDFVGLSRKSLQIRVTSLKALEISSISNSCSEGKAVVSG